MQSLESQRSQTNFQKNQYITRKTQRNAKQNPHYDDRSVSFTDSNPNKERLVNYDDRLFYQAGPSNKGAEHKSSSTRPPNNDLEFPNNTSRFQSNDKQAPSKATQRMGDAEKLQSNEAKLPDNKERHSTTEEKSSSTFLSNSATRLQNNNEKLLNDTAQVSNNKFQSNSPNITEAAFNHADIKVTQHHAGISSNNANVASNKPLNNVEYTTEIIEEVTNCETNPIIKESDSKQKLSKSKTSTGTKSVHKLIDSAANQLSKDSNSKKSTQQQVRSSTKNINLIAPKVRNKGPTKRDEKSSSSASQNKTFCQTFYEENRRCNALVIFGIKSLKFDQNFAKLKDSVNYVLMTLMNYEPVTIEIINSDLDINFTKIYEIKISSVFVENLANKTALFELYTSTSEEDQHNLLAIGDLHMKSLLYYPQKKLTAVVDLYSSSEVKRALHKRIGQLTIKMQLVLNLTKSNEYQDDIFDSKTNLLLDAENEVDETKEFVEVPLTNSATSCNKDSLFNIDINDSSSSEDLHGVKSSLKIPDWKRSLEEYAILKGYSSTLIKLNKWKEKNSLNIPIRNYDLINSYYKTEVTITIVNLIILKESVLMLNSSIQHLFVDYVFLTHSDSHMESDLFYKTSASSIPINFVRNFSINPDDDLVNCKLLVKAIRNNETINIKLVTEPSEDKSQVQTCSIIGTASINLFELIQEEDNNIDLKVPILTENDKVHVGFFVVNFSGVQAMREVALYMIKRDLDKSEPNFSKINNFNASLVSDDRYEVLSRFINEDYNENEESATEYNRKHKYDKFINEFN